MAILNVLSFSEYDMSSKDILDSITGEEKISTTLSSVYGYLEDLKNSGLIENGLSEIVKGKTVLMWKITNNGRALVGDTKGKTVEVKVIDKPTALLRSIENLDEKINMLRKMMVIVPAEWEVMLNDIIIDLMD